MHFFFCFQAFAWVVYSVIASRLTHCSVVMSQHVPQRSPYLLGGTSDGLRAGQCQVSAEDSPADGYRAEPWRSTGPKSCAGIRGLSHILSPPAVTRSGGRTALIGLDPVGWGVRSGAHRSLGVGYVVCLADDIGPVLSCLCDRVGSHDSDLVYSFGGLFSFLRLFLSS